MPKEHPATSVAQLTLERYKTRLSFWQAVWGTLISGGIAVAIPAAVDAYKARLETHKSAEDQKLKDKEIQLKILDSHQQYIANFLNTALNQDIELRIRFAEYFSFVSDPSYRPVWETFRSSLVSRRNDIRDQINSKEMQLDQLRARRASLTLEEQIDLATLERELNWINAEVGYVRRDSNVTAAAVPRDGLSNAEQILSTSGVAQLQRALCVTATGVFDSATRAQLRNFKVASLYPTDASASDRVTTDADLLRLRDAQRQFPNCQRAGFKDGFELGLFTRIGEKKVRSDLKTALEIAQLPVPAGLEATGSIPADNAIRQAITSLRTKYGLPGQPVFDRMLLDAMLKSLAR